MAKRAKDETQRAVMPGGPETGLAPPAADDPASQQDPWTDSADPASEVYSRIGAALRTRAARVLIVLLLIVGYTLVTRLEGLGRKPYHHDESIHALHSYHLYRGEGWQYDPVYHGPVVYYFNAAAYFLFGDSDYTGRLAPGVFGVLLVLLALALAAELGTLEALYAAGFIALSPTLYYFSRFVRDDVYGACWTVMMILGYLRYVRTRDWRWLYLVVVALSMAFCSKINALIIGFIFCSSVIVYALWYAFFGQTGPMPGAMLGPAGSLSWKERLQGLLVRHELVARGLLLFGGVVFAVAIYVVALSPPYPGSGGLRPVYWAITLGAIALGLLALDRAVLSWESASGTGLRARLGFYERHRPLVLLSLAFMAIFCLLYTNFFRLVPLPGGRDVSVGQLLANAFTDGLHYWYGQQLHPRIADVWYYYVPRLFVYELPLTLLVILGSFVRLSDRQRGVLILGLIFLVVADWLGWTSAAIGENVQVGGLTFMEGALFIGLVVVGGFLGLDDLRSGRPERALLVYWSVLSFIIYAKANEKVPWLGVHVVLPLTFYGATLAADLHRHLAATARGFTRVLVGLVVGGSIAYYLHAGIVVNVRGEADPREVMVYVQSTTDVLDVVDELEEIAYRDGTYYDTKFTIEDDASWPFSWYLRRYRSVGHLANISNLDGSTAAVLTKSPPDDQTRAMLENNGYEGTRYRLRAWWQPSWELTPEEAQAGLKGYAQYLRKMAAYLMWRETYPPTTGSTDFMFYRRAQVETAAKSGDGVASPPEQRPRLPEAVVPQPLANAAIVGGPGSEPGQLREPRGLAVAQDGSVYVVDTANDRVQRFAADGRHLATFGSNGNADGQFNKPGGIAIDTQGFVWVADTWNHRVQKFTPDGQFVLAYGAEPAFYGPRDVTVDDQGQVFITDTGHHKIVCLNEDGQYVREWGVKGTRRRQFVEPVGLAVSDEGQLYVADTGNRRIQVFDGEGNFVRSFAVAGWEYLYSEPYLSFDSAGRLWLSDSKNNRLQAYSQEGRYLGALGGAGQLEGAIGVAVGANDTMFVSDTQRHRLLRVNLGEQSVAAP